MSKLLATCAAAAVTATFALATPAGAADQHAQGLRNADQMEFSSARRHRVVRVYGAPRRYIARRYYNAPYYASGSYGPGYVYDDGPYYAGGYYGGGYYGGPYGYGRPYGYYGGPGVSVGVGPFGFGVGFGY